MSRFSVLCHRCGKSTYVDLSKTISDQRCRSCQGFLKGVDVSIGGAQPVEKRKMIWHRGSKDGEAPEWRDQEAPVIALRQRWPRFYRWSIVSGLVIFLAGIGYGTYLKFQHSRSAAREVLGQLDAPPVDIRFSPEWRTRATALARKALEAQSAVDLLPLLIHPEVSDEAVLRYYDREEKLPLGSDLEVDDYFVPQEPGNVVSFSFTDAGGRPRDMVVIEKPQGMFIDWPSMVGLGQISIRDFLRDQPGEAVALRVRARVGHYYNNDFSDTAKWLCLRLSDVTNENVVHGYVDRALPVAEALEKNLADPESGREVPDAALVVVIQRSPGNPGPDQARIVKLVSATWFHESGLPGLMAQADIAAAAAAAPASPPSGAPAPEALPEAPGALARPEVAAPPLIPEN